MDQTTSDSKYSIQHKEPQRVPQDSYQINKRRERASTPMHRLPKCHHRNPLVERQNTYQVNQYDNRHISSALKSIKVFNPITMKSQREKLNSSQEDREGKTQYDLTILKKPAIHQDRDISRTQERERERLNS